MALYKNVDFVAASTYAVFDGGHAPGVDAPSSGIYRCTVCGIEVVSTQGHPLPPLDHSNHSPKPSAGLWQLAVFANHDPS
ncbi:MAG: hypothetical protein ABJE95_33250 [Byssovorax sp.]